MRFKNSQVTVFIIVGLVILISIVLLLMFVNDTSNENKKADFDNIVSLFNEKGKYNKYTQTCIEQATKEGLYMIGMQGGVIYQSQAKNGKPLLGPANKKPYGTQILPYNNSGEIFDVSYAIRKPTLGTTYHPEIPFYPHGLTKLIPEPTTISPNYKYIFGNISGFTPLCDSNGPNRKNLTVNPSCETYDNENLEDTNSIQEYLTKYVENKTIECLRFSELPELSGSTIYIENISSEIKFGEDQIYIKMELPIVIELKPYRTVLRLNNFNTEYNIRLKKIHELVSHLIEIDSNNLFFDIVNDADALNDCKLQNGSITKCKKDGMVLYKKNNVCKNTWLCVNGNIADGVYDDILVVEDRLSDLDGKPYKFQVAIENRPPALDLIRNTRGSAAYFYDIISLTNNEITITPTGIDPDEDFHSFNKQMDGFYNYYGWKQDYDELLNCQGPSCDITDPNNFIRTSIMNPPRNWTQSLDYQATKRNATVFVGNQDQGVHSVKVEVCDEENLCDWQTVMIFVVNNSIAGGLNVYLDIPAGYTSLEDPYFLISTLKGADFNINNPRYEWFIFENTIYGTQGPLILNTIIPNENISIPGPNADIRNIKSVITQTYFKNPGNHTIKVDIIKPNNAPLGNPISNILQVKECLPHRSLSPPYPYNISDPYQANHSCCFGEPLTPDQPNWGTIIPATTNTLCYSFTEYGCRDDPHFKQFTGDAFITPQYNEPGTATAEDLANDIYKREFVRNCDGLSGNTCTGTGTDLRTYVKTCTECQNCVFNGTFEPNCENKAYGEVCNHGNFKCTQGSLSNYFGTDGPWLCQAACQNGDCSVSINCNCNSSVCGAICENPNDFYWFDQTCTYNCNAGSGGTCDYINQHNTICPAPDISTQFQIISDQGIDYKIYAADFNSPRTITNDNTANNNNGNINNNNNNNANSNNANLNNPNTNNANVNNPTIITSVCKFDPGNSINQGAQKKCIFSSCTSQGQLVIDPDIDCLDAGTHDNLGTCYYHPSGNTNCGLNGECNNHEYLADEVIPGLNPTCDLITSDLSSPGCAHNNICYMATCNRFSGWTTSPDYDIELNGNSLSCATENCKNGFIKTTQGNNEFCNTVRCKSTGWEIIAQNQKLPNHTTCTPNGWI